MSEGFPWLDVSFINADIKFQDTTMLARTTPPAMLIALRG